METNVCHSFIMPYIQKLKNRGFFSNNKNSTILNKICDRCAEVIDYHDDPEHNRSFVAFPFYSVWKSLNPNNAACGPLAKQQVPSCVARDYDEDPNQ